MQIRTILYQYIKTLIKHVFLLNFTHELLMSFRKLYKYPDIGYLCNDLHVHFQGFPGINSEFQGFQRLFRLWTLLTLNKFANCFFKKRILLCL